MCVGVGVGVDHSMNHTMIGSLSTRSSLSRLDIFNVVLYLEAYHGMYIFVCRMYM